MFNEDADLWAGSTDTQDIVDAVAPRYPRGSLDVVISELDQLLSFGYSEAELTLFIDRAGVRIGLGGLTVRRWLEKVVEQLRRFNASQG